MRAISVLGMCTVLLLVSAKAALAAELIGGPLQPPISGALLCIFLNTDDEPLAEVTIEAFNSIGASVGDIRFVNVPPLGIAELPIQGDLNPRSCKFSAPTSKSNMRGTVGVLDSSSGALLHAVVEAR